MAGNILYGIKKFGISVVTIIARVVITLIQLLVEVGSLAVSITGIVLKIFLAILLIGNYCIIKEVKMNRIRDETKPYPEL